MRVTGVGKDMPLRLEERKITMMTNKDEFVSDEYPMATVVSLPLILVVFMEMRVKCEASWHCIPNKVL